MIGASHCLLTLPRILALTQPDMLYIFKLFMLSCYTCRAVLYTCSPLNCLINVTIYYIPLSHVYSSCQQLTLSTNRL